MTNTAKRIIEIDSAANCRHRAFKYAVLAELGNDELSEKIKAIGSAEPRSFRKKTMRMVSRYVAL
jgi:hypothetical protein